MKKRMLGLSLLFLISSQSTYPLRTISASSLAGLSWASCFAFHKISENKITEINDRAYFYDKNLAILDVKILEAFYCLIAGVILPEYFLGTLPKSRLVHAQESFNRISRKKTMKKCFRNADDFYSYIVQEYGAYNYPLLAAKKVLTLYKDCLNKDKRALKKALNDTEKESILWRELYDAWYDLDSLTKKISILLGYINSHPSYEKLTKEVADLAVNRERVDAERKKAEAGQSLAYAHLLNVLTK